MTKSSNPKASRNRDADVYKIDRVLIWSHLHSLAYNAGKGKKLCNYYSLETTRN